MVIFSFLSPPLFSTKSLAKRTRGESPSPGLRRTMLRIAGSNPTSPGTRGEVK